MKLTMLGTGNALVTECYPCSYNSKEVSAMEKFIPYEKLSKKKKRELDAGKRTIWAISPVTRRPENPKAYNRKKAQKRMDDSGSVLSVFIARREIL